MVGPRCVGVSSEEVRGTRPVRDPEGKAKARGERWRSVFVCVQRGREINVRGLGASHLNDADDTGRDETSLSAKRTERRRKRELTVLVALPGGR